MGTNFRVDAPPGGWQDVGSWFDPNEFEDLFGDFLGGMFGGRAGRRRRPGTARASRGADIEATVEVPFISSVNGGTLSFQVRLPRACPGCKGTGRSGTRQCSKCKGIASIQKVESINAKISPGLSDGARILLKGRGQPGPNGGPAGDLRLIAKVSPHHFFQREGFNLLCEIPVTFSEATLGAEIKVPTLTGSVTVKIPAGTQGGQRLRLGGKGVAQKKGKKGDLYVKVKIVVPKSLNKKAKELVGQLDKELGINPRENINKDVS